jgi:cell wall-active antibiotic response 4TMS protein YvqF
LLAAGGPTALAGTVPATKFALPNRRPAPPGVPVRIHDMSMWRRDYLLPLFLVLLGIYFLLRNVGLLDWLHGDIVWPLLLIFAGLWLILRRTRA